MNASITWDQFDAVVAQLREKAKHSRTLEECVRSLDPEQLKRLNQALRELHDETARILNESETTKAAPLAGLAPSPVEGRLTPELREWALQLSTEEEILAGFAELREKGGAELSEFLHELEQVLDASDRAQR